MASLGVVNLLWSSVEEPVGLIPGLTMIVSGNAIRHALISCPDATTPSHPASRAARARVRISVVMSSCPVVAWRSSRSRLDRNGTVKNSGILLLCLSRAIFAPLIADNGMDSLSVKNLTPISTQRSTTEPIVFAMSPGTLRSTKRLFWRSASKSLGSSPVRNNCNPTLKNETLSRVSTVLKAMSTVGTSRATMSESFPLRGTPKTITVADYTQVLEKAHYCLFRSLFSSTFSSSTLWSRALLLGLATSLFPCPLAPPFLFPLLQFGTRDRQYFSHRVIEFLKLCHKPHERYAIGLRPTVVMRTPITANTSR
jgi:hypothetical protein